MNAFAYLPDDEPLTEAPLFYVEPPDGRRDWPEHARQAVFLDLLSRSRGIEAWPVPNAGKRNPSKARAERIRGGVFDTTVTQSQAPNLAVVEFKGYDKHGQPGKLRPNQIEFGNRMFRLGVPVACFFSPQRALAFLRDNGFPVEVRAV